MSGRALSTVGLPFTAISGMENAKKALLCLAVNPRIKGVLIKGCSGVAKTTLARSMSGGLTGKRIVNIPLNVTEERLFGTMDIESALRDGTMKVQRGLLFESDGNLTYLDDVNLFDRRILASVMDAVHVGRVIVERECFSDSYPCTTSVIATMNPEDSDLDPHMLDRFDICAYAFTSGETGQREEILRRNMEFCEDPSGFASAYSDEEAELTDRVSRARDILPFVSISDELITIITDLCSETGTDGHRGDLSMANTAMSLAALDGRDEVTRRDLEEAAGLCLNHRARCAPPPPRDPEEEKEEDEKESPEGNRNRPPEDRSRNPEKQDGGEDGGIGPTDPPDGDGPEEEDRREEGSRSECPDDTVFGMGEQFRVVDCINGMKMHERRTNSRKGRRGVTESCDGTGRYARYRVPDGPARDIAFDATVRAAAAMQWRRRPGRLSVVIEKEDIREKVRERRSGCTILFLVDASGSLGVRKRMITVKGTILSMLRDSYVKRDRVGMMAFRRDTAELVLPPTKSVEYSYRKLEEIPTGGKTPLGDALVRAGAFMGSYTRIHPGERCYVVLVTDGRANVPIGEGADANEEVLDLAGRINVPRLGWIVIDAGMGYPHFDNAVRISKKLGGEYFRLEDLNADRLAERIRASIAE